MRFRIQLKNLLALDKPLCFLVCNFQEFDIPQQIDLSFLFPQNFVVYYLTHLSLSQIKQFWRNLQYNLRILEERRDQHFSEYYQAQDMRTSYQNTATPTKEFIILQSFAKLTKTAPMSGDLWTSPTEPERPSLPRRLKHLKPIWGDPKGPWWSAVATEWRDRDLCPRALLPFVQSLARCGFEWRPYVYGSSG